MPSIQVILFNYRDAVTAFFVSCHNISVVVALYLCYLQKQGYVLSRLWIHSDCYVAIHEEERLIIHFHNQLFISSVEYLMVPVLLLFTLIVT